MQLTEFLVRLGVVSDTTELNEFSNGLKNVGKVATGLVGVLTGLTAGVTAFFGSALSGLDELANLSADTNTSLDYIQKLGYAAQLSGSSVEEANASIKGLSQVIGEAANGLGRGEATFKALGMSAKNADGSIKSTEQVIGEVQKKLVGLSKQQQISILQKLGISQSMVQLLSDTSGRMGELMSEAEALGIVTANGADAAGDYNDAMDRMSMVAGALRTNIAVGLAPALSEMVNKFKDWLVANKELLRDGIEKTVKFILAAFQAVVNFATAIYKVIDATIGWKAAMVVLIGILIKVKWAMITAFAANPITWIVLAIVGLIALVDDFMTYLEGGESFFGEYWQPFADGLEAIKPVIEWLKPYLERFVNYVVKGLAIQFKVISTIFQTVGKIIAGVILLLTGDFAGYFEFLKDLFGDVFDIVAQPFIIAGNAISSVFEGISEFVGAVWDYIGAVGQPVIDFFMKAVNKVFGAIDKVRSFFSGIVDKVKSGVKSLTGEVEDIAGTDIKTMSNAVATTTNYAVMPKAPLAPRFERPNNINTVNQNISIVAKNDNPTGTAKEIKNELKREQQRAQHNTNGAAGY